jgi:hypothetical protein
MNSKKTLLFLGAILTTLALTATNYVSLIDGDWNNPSNWSPHGVPNVTNSAAWPGDNVVIEHAITYSGNLSTQKQSSIEIRNGGQLSVTGTLDIANTNSSRFNLLSGGGLTVGNLIVSTCCNMVTLNGTVTTANFSYTGSKPIVIGGQMTVTASFNGGTNSQINFIGGSLSVGVNTTLGGSVLVTVEGGAQLDFGNLSLTGNADIKGVNVGGAIGFNGLSLANSSTTIQCVNNSCNYNSTSGPPPNPLDLVTGMQVLPVELLDFQASLKENTALLSWTTATETDNDYFLLEHSTDGKQFSTIAIIPGVGNSSAPVDYEYTHKEMTSGNNYYRLWQYDYDGSSTILGLRQLRTHPSTFTLAGISPNPGYAGQSLRLELPTNTHSIEVHLVNSSGQLWSLPFAAGAQQVTLPSPLPSGMYYLRVQHSDQAQTIPVTIIGK